MKLNSIRLAASLSAIVVSLAGSSLAADTTTNLLVLHLDRPLDTINRNIYGQFSEHLGRCIYEGVWVGEDSSIPNTRGIRNDVVAALRKIKIPVLRWPGGCFADEYHWRDGIGPREKRPSMINTHWGGVVENNHFGTHEFLDFCEQLGCEPYICGNVGSGTVTELQQWVEYITFDGKSPMSLERTQNGHAAPWKVRYWGIGNENWGCGGNMTPEFYADNYKRFATYVRNFGGNQVYKIACGPNGANTNWTEVLMRDAGKRMNGLALHFYCGSSRKKQPATQFEEADWFFQLKNALRMEDLVARHCAIMDKYDPDKKVALIVDEWGAWHAVEPGSNPGFLYQQNTLRDALVAGVTLNIFNNHADRVKMANIAQTINVLQAMILTDKEKMLLTPTYHVFDMFTAHMDAKLLRTELTGDSYVSGTEKIPAVSVSASRDKDGKVHLTLCNLKPEAAAEVVCRFQGVNPTGLSGMVLTADTMQTHNTFAQPKTIQPQPFTGFKRIEGGFTATLPSKSVVLLEL